jgi:hypothetical protein
MTALPPHLEALEADLSRAAGRRVRQLQRRRRVTQTAAVVVSTLALTGAGLAASGIEVFGWLAGGQPTEARYSVDPDTTYTGPVPQTIGCSTVTANPFTCVEAITGEERVYDLMLTASPPPFSSRQELLALLDQDERRGLASPAMYDRAREGIAAVSDEFLERLGLLLQFQSVSASWNDGRGELVPPNGVPWFVVCPESRASELVCRSLRGAQGVPAGAPIYRLRPSDDWQVREDQTANDDTIVAEYDRLFLEVFEKPFTPAELRFFITFSTAAYESTGEAPVEEATPAPAEQAPTP